MQPKELKSLIQQVLQLDSRKGFLGLRVQGLGFGALGIWG